MVSVSALGPETCAQKNGDRWRSALSALLCLLFGLWGSATAQEQPYFVIDAPTLSPALIQFSQQSDRPIVFADRLTRNLPAPAVVGTMTHEAALDQLLVGSGLAWEWVEERIIAVYEADCQAPASSCNGGLDTISKYPVYQPGMEETYVYGNLVTGSRIRRSGYKSASPVDVFSAPDIELSGAQTLGELLKFVPAVSGNSISTAISNGGNGTATVTLRGLPANNTLVLINGRRVANDGLAGESVDLNSIPPAAVERIEILKDGASAIYGSDAIAGVVNVIMKQDFYGTLAQAFYGETGDGDLQTRTVTLQHGSGLPNGSFFVSGSVYDQEPIYSRDRKVSRSADTRRQGGSDQRSSATPSARVTLPSGETLIAEGEDYREVRDGDLFNYQDYTTAVVPLRRTSLYGNLSYDFSDQITGLLDLAWVQTDARATLAPTPVFTAFEQDPLSVSADNVFNPFGVAIDDVRRRLLEFPSREQHNESEVGRVSAIVEGLFADWNWDLGYTWSRSEATEVTRAIVNADRLRRAIGPADQCLGAAVDGCTAVDLMGPSGSITPQQVQYIKARGEVSGYYSLSSLSANISRALPELPFGRGDIAFGIEHRREATRKKPSDLLAATGTIGATNFEATRGDRTVTEFYGETVIPAWRSASGLYSLDLEAALRYSDYSDFGTTTNPKLGLRLQLGPALLLRASWADGFRAPSLNELYQGKTEEQAFLSDPCTLPAGGNTLPGCSGQADPSRNQFLTIKGGNVDLKPESSDSYSAGFVWSPVAAPGLNLSADYFQIDQRNVVASGAQFIVNQNALFGRFEEEVTRDETGNLIQVDAKNINIGRRKVTGADLALTYHLPERRWGKLTAATSATWIAEYLAQIDNSARKLDLAGTFRDEASEGLGGIPEWKGQVSLRWSHQRWQGSYEIHYVSSLQELIPGSVRRREIDDWQVHDLQLSYTFGVLQGLRLSLGVDNLFDDKAPLAASAFNDNIDGRTHELRGRFWYTRFSQRF